MDDFVCNKLTEWGFSKYIQLFKDEEIDKESLYDLDDQEIANLILKTGPRSKFKKRLRLLKEENPETPSAECQQEHGEEEAVSAQDDDVLPSTSDASDKGKRKVDLQGESSCMPAIKRRLTTKLGSYTEETILSKVKTIMAGVNELLPNQHNKFNKFLRDKISSLETDKREIIGVFGKTGAGKSSLINAIIGEKDLLPSGIISACTSVMIKVEANMQTPLYEADIEFITKEEWKDELWSLINFLGDNADREDDDDYYDTVEKLSALYGDEWKNKSPESLMENKYFREIPEFLHYKRKTLLSESAAALSAKFAKYTRSDSKDGESNEVKRWYWPLVKCVTLRVPNNGLLQHVTLVDLPGNGDCNKSRDRMWKGVVGSCSAVWIVTEMNRAAAEKEPWEILKSTSTIMGNGGECQRIHFICTKSDLIDVSDDHSAAAVRALILERNCQAKKEVITKFSKLDKVKKHFSDDSFQVFTVSSKEFLKKKHLNRSDTEIPQLQEFLQELNDWHSETLNYVSGARGILSLIQGASHREGADKKTVVHAVLEAKMRSELDKVMTAMKETHWAFEKHLNEGVEKSKGSCEKVLKSFLYHNKSGGGFHRILKCVVANSGTYTPKKKKAKQLNLNMKLASCLTDSIDDEFKKTFPNEGKCAPFNGVINAFSLDTKWMIQEYKEVGLQLIFLKTEEEKMKTKLHKIIRERKKTIYSSLMTTIEEAMQDCYEKANVFSGRDMLKNMRESIMKDVLESKDQMFEQAKDVMMSQLRDLMMKILETLENTMLESIELSLSTDDVSIPDVTVDLERVTIYYKELMGSSDESIWIDSPGSAAALDP